MTEAEAMPMDGVTEEKAMPMDGVYDGGDDAKGGHVRQRQRRRRQWRQRQGRCMAVSRRRGRMVMATTAALMLVGEGENGVATRLRCQALVVARTGAEHGGSGNYNGCTSSAD